MGILLAEVLLAQQSGRSRLKLCSFATCSVAFYDRSKNTGALPLARCANYVNLRNSRSRARS